MNETFANAVTSTAFSLHLSKRMVDVLLWLDLAEEYVANHPEDETLWRLSYPGGGHFVMTCQALRRRGLKEHHFDREGCTMCAGRANQVNRPITHHHYLTPEGRLVAQLCRRAGLECTAYEEAVNDVSEVQLAAMWSRS